MSASEVIGRDGALREVDAFLAAAPAGPSALVLSGEAGIGKTLLWEAGVERARSLGYRLLAHRSVEAEASFGFAGLADVVGPIFDEVADELPPPRRRALEVALLLADAEGPPPEPHAIGLALLDVLGALAGDGPVVLALDDVQWLDASSTTVLAAALRRLTTERVRLLATARTTADADRPWDLLLPVTWLRLVPLSPLRPGAVHRLVRERLGIELSRPLLARIHEVSGGNPYFALELARTPRRLPKSLTDLLGERLVAFPDEMRGVLLLAAALARPTVERVAAAHGDEATAFAAVEAAAARGLIVLEEDRIRFAHPLLASLCYEQAALFRRRYAHRRLAAVVTDPEERARHLALASAEPSEEVASQLDAGAAHAAARGAAAAAADLAKFAAARTPPENGAARRHRQLAAARLHWLAGDIEGAHELYDDLLADLPSGVERADVLHAVSLTGREDLPTRARLCEQALAESGEDDARATEILAQLAMYRWFAGDLPSALHAARAGLERARRLGDRRWLAIAMGRVGYIETYALENTPGLLEEAVGLEDALDEPLAFYQSPRFPLAAGLLERDEPAGACEILEGFMGAALRHGAEHTVQFARGPLTLAEWRRGRWDAALRHARALREFAEQVHDPQYQGFAEWLNAMVEADLGSLDDARASAQAGLEGAAAVRDEIFAIANLAVLGHVELLAGDTAAAVNHLRDLPARMLRSGHPHGIHHSAWPDAIEALVAHGELEDADRHLARYEEVAAAANRLARIGAARCRALLAAARGELAGALRAAEESLGAADPPTYPFERARTLLVLGAMRRRALQRRAARDALEDALATFDELGARPWAAKAHDEIARISGRRPPTDALTAAERRVADLASQGHRNKEIAAELVVGVRTVETTLARVYRKLGVRSRTELAVRLANREDPASKV